MKEIIKLLRTLPNLTANQKANLRRAKDMKLSTVLEILKQNGMEWTPEVDAPISLMEVVSYTRAKRVYGAVIPTFEADGYQYSCVTKDVRSNGVIFVSVNGCKVAVIKSQLDWLKWRSICHQSSY